MSLFSCARADFHRCLIEGQTLSTSGFSKFSESFIASNADSGQKMSVKVANLLAEKIASNVGSTIVRREKKKEGQTLGNEFEDHCANFLSSTFDSLQHLRPGTWVIEKVGGRSEGMIGKYEQYSHLSDLNRLAKEHDELRAFLGEGYIIAPDVVIARKPESDEALNLNAIIVDEKSCLKAKLRAKNHEGDNAPNLILHASVSCKFTMRSDRAQNTRTEALNLIRSRKGRSPHIVSLTAEPTPSRIASLALGTGDMDCVYHFALYELVEALRELDYEDALDTLEMMIEGKRVKDISDLPLDLAV
ncbi:NgoMIV family type II restriction endonuclease [Teredinibacter waterburyi]|uniref:NgoMIV family type II restriction endonuclease n=1 Tax=Teredinibacter waterburyi TaxID=1500538 RepID=UPI00165EF763|nr:NgoMIV family type II restriction endonuclease [Teredinibacter waterburyi]